MNSNFKPGPESTKEYFSNISNVKVGDRLSELLSFWVTVIKLDNEKIITLEGTNSLVIREYTTFEDFRQRFKYTTNDNYWVFYMGNKPEMLQLIIDSYKKNNFEDKISGNRQINIDSILYDL